MKQCKRCAAEYDGKKCLPCNSLWQRENRLKVKQRNEYVPCTKCQALRLVGGACPACARIASHQYVVANREELRARARAKRWANLEESRRKEALKKMRQRKNNPEKQKQYADAYEAKHRAKLLKAKLSERRATNYGISDTEFDALREKQGGVCAICHRAQSASADAQHQNLSVDHDHATGVIRGLLCNRCNRAIGLLQDDPRLLIAAARYLKRNRANQQPAA